MNFSCLAFIVKRREMVAGLTFPGFLRPEGGRQWEGKTEMLIA